MNKKLSCVMLIDDNPEDNFFHEREIKKNNLATTVIKKESGIEALEYLKSWAKNKEIQPDLIFLDINMPGMNGWEFLGEYDHLDKELQSQVVIMMLTSSDSYEDKEKAKKFRFVSDYIIKPLVKEKMNEIITKYFIG